MRSWLPAAGLLLAACAHVQAPPGEAALPQEAVRVLQRFVGTWTTDTTITRHDPQATLRSRGRAEACWTMEGRFVEFRSHTIPPGSSDLQVMTYDAESGRFVQWLFDSSGYVHQAYGRWLPDTSTLIWHGEVAGAAFVIHDRFEATDLMWALVRKDGRGRLLQTIEGVVRRRAATPAGACTRSDRGHAGRG
jgi:hypothetical protein